MVTQGQGTPAHDCLVHKYEDAQRLTSYPDWHLTGRRDNALGSFDLPTGDSRLAPLADYRLLVHLAFNYRYAPRQNNLHLSEALGYSADKLTEAQQGFGRSFLNEISDHHFWEQIYVRRPIRERQLLEMLEKDELVILAGERGSGKSTLLHHLIENQLPDDMTTLVVDLHRDFNLARRKGSDRPDSDSVLDLTLSRLRQLTAIEGTAGFDKYCAYTLFSSDKLALNKLALASRAGLDPNLFGEDWIRYYADNKSDPAVVRLVETTYEEQPTSTKLIEIVRYFTQIEGKQLLIAFDNSDDMRNPEQAALVQKLYYIQQPLRYVGERFIPIVTVRAENLRAIRRGLGGGGFYSSVLVRLEGEYRAFGSTQDPPTAPIPDATTNEPDLDEPDVLPSDAQIQGLSVNGRFPEHILLALVSKRLEAVHRSQLIEQIGSRLEVQELATSLGFTSGIALMRSQGRAFQQFLLESSEARQVIEDLEMWHNGSIRNIARDISGAINALCSGLTSGPSYAELVLEAPLVHRRELRSLLFRQQVFNETVSLDRSVLSTVSLFDDPYVSDQPLKVNFPIFHVMLYLANRENEHVPVTQIITDMERVGRTADEVIDCLTRLAAPRDGGEDTGLISVEPFPEAGEPIVRERAIAYSLPAGNYLIERLAKTVEYSFWSALTGSIYSLEQACGHVLPDWRPGKPIPRERLNDPLYRAEVSVNYVSRYVGYYMMTPFRKMTFSTTIKQRQFDESRVTFMRDYRNLFKPRLYVNMIARYGQSHIENDLMSLYRLGSGQTDLVDLISSYRKCLNDVARCCRAIELAMSELGHSGQ